MSLWIECSKATINLLYFLYIFLLLDWPSYCEAPWWQVPPSCYSLLGEEVTFSYSHPCRAGANYGKSSSGTSDLLSHTASHVAAEIVYSREKVGKHLHYFLRKYPRGLTAANQFQLPPGKFQIEDYSAFWQLLCLPDSKTILPGLPEILTPGKPPRHVAKEVSLTLAVRFPISPLLQTLRLLPWTPEKDLIVPGIHSHIGEEPIIRYIIQMGFSFLLFSIFSLESEWKYSWKCKCLRAWRFQVLHRSSQKLGFEKLVQNMH